MPLQYRKYSGILHITYYTYTHWQVCYIYTMQLHTSLSIVSFGILLATVCYTCLILTGHSFTLFNCAHGLHCIWPQDVYCLFGLHLLILFWFYDSNMALLIKDHNIQYYHMDVLRSIYLGHSYFASSDYMIVWPWISNMLLHPDHVTLTWPSLYKYTKFYLTAVRVYFCSSSMAEYCSCAQFIFQNTVVARHQKVWHRIMPNTKMYLNKYCITVMLGNNNSIHKITAYFLYRCLLCDSDYVQHVSMQLLFCSSDDITWNYV